MSEEKRPVKKVARKKPAPVKKKAPAPVYSVAMVAKHAPDEAPIDCVRKLWELYKAGTLGERENIWCVVSCVAVIVAYVAGKMHDGGHLLFNASQRDEQMMRTLKEILDAETDVDLTKDVNEALVVGGPIQDLVLSVLVQRFLEFVMNALQDAESWETVIKALKDFIEQMWPQDDRPEPEPNPNAE